MIEATRNTHENIKLDIKWSVPQSIPYVLSMVFSLSCSQLFAFLLHSLGTRCILELGNVLLYSDNVFATQLTWHTLEFYSGNWSHLMHALSLIFSINQTQELIAVERAHVKMHAFGTLLRIMHFSQDEICLSLIVTLLQSLPQLPSNFLVSVLLRSFLFSPLSPAFAISHTCGNLCGIYVLSHWKFASLQHDNDAHYCMSETIWPCMQTVHMGWMYHVIPPGGSWLLYQRLNIEYAYPSISENSERMALHVVTFCWECNVHDYAYILFESWAESDH